MGLEGCGRKDDAMTEVDAVVAALAVAMRLSSSARHLNNRANECVMISKPTDTALTALMNESRARCSCRCDTVLPIVAHPRLS